MKIYDITRLPSTIELGYDGENNWRPQSFDCASLLKNHPNGVLTLWLLPHGETQAFPVALERDGNTVVWTPLSEEMTARTGAFQIVCTDGTDVGKSAVSLFRVGESIIPGAEHPAAVPSWATQTIERAESAADRAEEAAESIDIEALEARIAQAVADYLSTHPISAPVTSVNGKTGEVDLDADDVSAATSQVSISGNVITIEDTARGTIAAYAITPASIGAGTYSKPSGGIPKTDLASDVQTSLGKADTALQQHQSLSGYATETYVQQQIAAIPDELPAVTTSDNGKFLRVVNGAWTAEAGDEYDAYSALPSDTASGAIASFPDGADDAPVKSLVAQIAPVQSGSGDPSPTNIRPISGWTSATVTRTGADNQSDTYTIAFPAEAGTVYGGTLDVTNGVLTVDSAIVDMGTLNWIYYPNQQRMVAQVNSAKPAAANVGLDGACSVYKVVNTAYRLAPDKSIVISNNFISNLYAAMVVHDEDYTDAATFKTAVSGQTLVFQIKNPVTYQLTPTEVTTLLGVNNIWADTGDVAVDYRADTGLYIQKLSGALQTKAITDTGGYFTTDTVEGALQEIGAELAGVNTLIGSGVIT